MSDKKRKLGNENGVIIALLTILLVLVAAIVGVVVMKNNAPIAKFDGGKVTKKEYQVYYELFSNYLAYYGYDAEEIPKEILLKAAQDKMILTDAKAAGVKLSKEDKDAVDEIFSNQDTIDNFQKQYKFSIDTLRTIYYDDYIIAAYIEKLAAEAEDEKIEEYIKSKYSEGEEADLYEYDTSHILFSFSTSSGTQMSDEEKAELKKKAEDVLQKALAGEDFAELAKQYSEDSGTASNGGKYVMYMDGYTTSEYAKAVKKMAVGEVKAKLVESNYGYHIIKLNAKTENGRLKSETERSEYANSLYNNVVEDRNLQYDEEKLKQFVLSINPTAYDKDETTDNATVNY